MEPVPPWYVAAFQDDYLRRYGHRDKSQAEAEIPFLLTALALPPGARLLDVCCGAGRHSGGFARAGLQVAGVDLSLPLLAHARAGHAQPFFARADMRNLPFRRESFSAAVNLFTSFGYFENEDENQKVLREVSRVLKPGGRFLLDFFNLDTTLPGLVPESRRSIDGKCIVERRRYDAQRKRLEKEMLIECASSPPARLLESVRAYDADELAGLFAKAGLEVKARYGDLNGTDFNRQSSPRCVTLGLKK